MKVRIKKLHPDAVVPSYATDGAACFDLHAVDVPDGQKWIFPGKSVFRTGLAFEIPEGWVMNVYSRSGHGFKFDTRLSNSVGVIDSDYRGEVVVALYRDAFLAVDDFVVRNGDRIAQARLERVERVEFEVVDELSSTARGAGGFGSTGR